MASPFECLTAFDGQTQTPAINPTPNSTALSLALAYDKNIDGSSHQKSPHYETKNSS